MTTIQSTMQTLSSYSFVSSSDKAALSACSDVTSFFEKLVTITEKKAESYVESCLFSIQQISKDRAKAIDSIVDCAYRAFLELETFSSVCLLRPLLEKEQNSLLLSLGIRAHTEQNHAIDEIAKKVFVKFISRYRLFQMIQLSDLSALCQQVQQSNPTLYPGYLLNAFYIEKQVAQILHSSNKNHYMQIIQVNSAQLVESCKNLVFYLQSTISVSDQAIQNRYFNQIKSPESMISFAQSISEGFVGKILEPNILFDTKKTNSTLLQKESIYQKCMPALSFLGVSVSVSDIYDKSIKEIEEALAQSKIEGETFRKKIEDAKKAEVKKVDDWRASIPSRGFRIEATSFGNGFNIK